MKKTLTALCLLSLSSAVSAAPVFMSVDWAKAACDGWNQSGPLTKELGGDWIQNNADRGYKVIQIYRTDCPDSPRVELTISAEDGMAKCTYGGAVVHEELNADVDYLMYANDEDWVCMGKGDWGCGAAGAMMTGKLNFAGPKMEAMSVMGPFNGFLQLTGQIDSDRGNCP